MTTTKTNEKKGYLAFFAGESEPGKPYAYHLEATVTGEPEYYSAADGKPSRITFNAALGRNPWLLLGEEIAKSATPENVPYCNEAKPFVRVTAFDAVADNLKGKLTKGSKVVMCGVPQENSYENKKTGETVANVQFVAHNVYPLACRASEGGNPRKFVTRMPKAYTVKNTGELKTANVATLVAGTIKDRSVVQTINGQKCLSFRLEIPVAATKLEAVVNGTYDKNTDYGTYALVNCSVWGDRAERVGNVLKPGNQIAVTGTVRTREYKGDTYVNLSVMFFSVMKWAEGAATAASNNAAEAPAQTSEPPAQNGVPSGAPAQETATAGSGTFDYAALMDEDDGELPF